MLVTLIILVIAIIASLIFVLAAAADEYNKDTESKEEIRILKYGGITLLMLATYLLFLKLIILLPSCRAVGLMFGLAVILLFLLSITFFMGANALRVCYSIAEDPPNDLPSYELLSRVPT